MYFDIEDGNDYFEVIKYMEEKDYFIENDLGDPRGMDWDIDFLRTIIKTILRDHREELQQTIPDFQNLNLVGSFIYNAMAYATVNNRNQVHKEEMINTFKNWNYIPFYTKKDVLDTLYEEQDLSDIPHPFNYSNKPKNKVAKKVIAFQPRKNTSSK